MARRPTRSQSDAASASPRRDAQPALAAIASRLDRDGPIPLYHQLAEHLRWEIGVGRIGLGATLPPARLVALTVGLNYHTVRRAYAELRRRGILDSTRRRGTSVVGAETLQVRRGTKRRVTVIECNLTQASQIAQELAGLGVAACGWLLEWPDPPPGDLLTTPFHLGQVRRRWPGRTVRVAALRVHTELAHSIERRLRALRLRRVVLVERDCSTASSMRDSIRGVLSSSTAKFTAIAASKPEQVVARYPDALVLYAPRVFDGLPWSLQSHPRVVEARFQIAIASATELFSASVEVGERALP